ncbi:ABC-type branched-chain amino acid transport system protein [Paramagnetospirillum caucaseum]|uniref:ABC-type branched-chain amino acid transport system protein n=1 Tax=Paramagnetospirillum caucaseum TaxID=1244869 RepID=M2Z2H4_9PROT|nr:ABC transporter substrate-binding protein [Paramagnetospirillum caucaseum]EME68515.1 ABC-type branched-chain amino acid transport system protein [Paramagnetospirillum caucaseum]
MNMSMSRRGLLALAVGLGVSGWGLPAGAADVIRIGAPLSTTGPASFLGEPEKKVLEMYVEQINKEGGVLGRKLELIVYDDGGQAEKAVGNVKRLIQNDNVDVLIGGTTTATTMAMVPLIERGEVPFISLAGAIVVVEPVKKWVFKVSHNDRMAAEKVLADMRKRGITKAAIISEDAGFGKSGHDETLKVAKDIGVEIIADEIYSSKDPDVTAQLTKIKNTPGVQAVFNFGFGQGPAIVTKNYRQIGITVPLYQSHGVASKEFIRLAGDAAEGVKLPASGLVVADQLAATDPQKPVVTLFSKTYQAKAGTDPSTFAGHAYDALQIVMAAVNRAKSTDKAKVRDEIEKTSGYVGTGGIVSMTPADHLGLSLRAFHMVEAKAGAWSLVD